MANTRANTRSARRARQRALDAKNAGATRCQFQQGPHGRCGSLLEVMIDRRLGIPVTRCPQCERRLQGICRDCPKRVAGRVGSALRCGTCKKAFKCRRQHEARQDPAYREVLNARYRQRWHASPEFRAQRRVTKRAWHAKHPEKAKVYSHRYHLKQTPGYIAGYQRNNARPERQAAKRAQALKKYYELHPDRPRPVCRGCGLPIAWTPPGRPPKDCDGCVSASLRRRRKRSFPAIAPLPPQENGNDRS